MLLCFIVSDPLLEWNNRQFIVQFSPNVKQVKVMERETSSSLEDLGDSIYTLHINIQTLTTMLMGYKRPLYLRQINRLDADDITIDILEEIIPEGKAYFSDYF